LTGRKRESLVIRPTHQPVERVVLVGGTRPEFIKLHPLAVSLAQARIPTLLLTTNQHQSAMMRDTFLEQLQWACPVESLSVKGTNAPFLIADVLTQLPERLEATDMVIVEGDTNSVLAASLVANKRGLMLAHVEAGLRSYDLRMPEEHNRRLCDHISDLLFCPTALDYEHLRAEDCLGEAHVVGNTVLDAVRMNFARTSPSPPIADEYVLVTLHRQENVDDERFLHHIVDFLQRQPSSSVFPVHPRTEDRLRAAGLWQRIAGNSKIHLVPPMDYLSFLSAMRYAHVIVTDSGGVQEEATAPEIRRPVIVLRRSTERVPAIESRFSVLSDAASPSLDSLVADLSWFEPTPLSPFGDGHAAERIAAIIGRTVGAATTT